MSKFFFKLILLSIFLIFRSSLFACDESTATLTSLTDNGDGTYTVVLDVCTEFLGLEATPYSWSIDFNDPLNIISATPATLTTGTGDDYDLGITGGTATWTCSGFLPSHNSSLFCYTLTLVLDAQPTTSVDVITNNDAASSFANCTHTLTFPPPPPSCDITAVSATPSACNPADNSYTTDVTVTYTNPPASGTINVNGQTFPITSSPQTVTLTGLTSDGNNVNVTAIFSADATCTFTQNNAYTAPTPCTCSITSVSGTPSACNPTDNSYTTSVTVTYSNPPASGNIVVNGQTFPVTASPQTVTLTGLTSDGANVNVSANFSADPTCTLTQNNAYTAPSPCTCSITALTGTPSACNPADDSYTASITVTYSNPPGSGSLTVNGQNFPITASPQTVTLTGLISDGNSVNLSANFTADPTCTTTQNNAYTAPNPCNTGCAANPGTISQ